MDTFKDIISIITCDETWICYDPLTKQQSIQWMFQYEMRPSTVQEWGNWAKHDCFVFYPYWFLKMKKQLLQIDICTTICWSTMLLKVQKKTR